MPQHLVVPGFLNVENLSLQRQNRLKLSVAALLGCPACALSLYEIELATVRLPLRAVRQFTWQSTAIKGAFTACQIASFTRCLTCPCSINRFVDNLLRSE